MQELKAKDVLTTGEVAKICHVAPRTVSKWFDSGSLKGYRIPGSKDRRIPLNQLISFMKEHKIPLGGLKTGNTRIVILNSDQNVVDVLQGILKDETRYDVHVVETAFAAGVMTQKARPHVMLVDVTLSDVDPGTFAKDLRTNPDLQLTKLIAMVTGTYPSSHKLSDDNLLLASFDSILRKPFRVAAVIAAVENVMRAKY